MMTPWPKYSEEEISAVSMVLRSGKVNYLYGQNGNLFEKEFSDFVGTKYALALANGTLALDVALRALNISKNDEVIVTPRSYIASVSCVSLLGAKPVFADVDYNSQNITAEQIRKLITKNTKAIICVHLGGMPCEMDSIMKLAKKNNLFVIEDCAQAHGAEYKGKSVGSFGHVSTWSFCNDKIMTLGGEGGMITTNSKKIDSFARAFNNHGKNFKKLSLQSATKIPKFRYIHDDIGTNYRMTEMQASIGRIQLKKLKKWTRIRTNNAYAIYRAIEKLPITKIPIISPELKHAFYKCYVMLDLNHLKKDWSRDKIIYEINLRGVSCFSGSCPEIYLEKCYEQFSDIALPNAKALGKESIMLTVHPSLTKKEINQIKSAVKEVLLLASK